jgi:hypothetical protein
MPIYEEDPWRRQYFQAVTCPPHVHIPTDDPDAYRRNPELRWIYNKLLLAESQGLACAPHGIEPTAYPVFSKPIINLRGMGRGSCILESRERYLECETPGHFWMTLLRGEHVSSDIAVMRGEMAWIRHAVGAPLAGGTFNYWMIDIEARPRLERYAAEWVQTHLAGYTGMLNLESIGDRLIEAHLRFTDQWPDLYGPGWLEAVVGLYQNGSWNCAGNAPRRGFSVVLFGPHGPCYRPPADALVDELRRLPDIASLQITFHADRPAARHSMPPGGFRLAIVNCWDLEAGLRARARLAEMLVPSTAIAPIRSR